MYPAGSRCWDVPTCCEFRVDCVLKAPLCFPTEKRQSVTWKFELPEDMIKVKNQSGPSDILAVCKDSVKYVSDNLINTMPVD